MLSNLKSVEENKEYLRSVIGAKGSYIDWKNSVSKEIEYEYDGISEYFKGALKIVKYENRYIYFEGYNKGICTSHLIKCKLGGILGFITSEFRYKIGDTINHLTIIDMKYRKDKRGQNRKYYKYKCNECENVDWISEYDLKGECGCNACCLYPRKAVLGVNTIWDKTRWMVNLGVSIEDAKTSTPNSNKKITVKCPDCGKIKQIAPNTIYQRHSISCSCGDGISYPEKLMESALIQLKIEYKRQYKTDWSQNKIYDFYLLDINTIIEVHGEQHYKESKSFTRKVLKDEQENDKFKKELALKNGIKYYIIIDCRKSDLEYIKNNILNSELNELFDLSKVDWVQCGEYALRNKVKEVCDYYSKHQGISTVDLAKEFGMGKTTIRMYLNQGTKIGWCEYDGKETVRRSGRRSGKLGGKLVSQFLEDKLVETYPSTMEAERQTGINHRSISACCNGKLKTAGGYVWRYVE